MKDTVGDFMQKIMEIDPVRVGPLPALVAELLMHQQVLAAVSASFFRLDHGDSFIKIINSILILSEFLK